MILAFAFLLAAASPLTFKLAPSGVTPGTYTNPIVTVDSKGRVIDVTPGRPLNYVNAMDFGPSGTGSTTDDTAELQAAIDATPEGGALYIPAGAYLLSGTLTVSKSITIFGDKKQTVLYNAPWFPTNQDTIKFTATSVKSGVVLEDFAIYPHPGYTGLETPGQNGIVFDCAGSSGWSSIVVRNLFVEAKNGAAIKVDNTDGDSTTANGIYIYNNILLGGVQLVNVGSGAIVADNLIPYSAKGDSLAMAGVQLSLYSGATGGDVVRNWITAHGGISVSGNGIFVGYNNLLSSGVTNSYTTNAIYIGSSTNVDVRGNNIDPLISAGTWYGVNISSSANSARVGQNGFNPAQWASYSANKILNNGTLSVIEVDGDVISTANNYFAYGTTNTFGGEIIATNGITLGGARRTTWPTGGTGTNASTIFVNNSTQVDGPSFNDSAEIAKTVSGTNITDSIVANSIATNKISTTFYDWVMRPKGIYIDAGIATRLDDSGEVLFNMAGATNAIAGLVDYSIDSLKFKTNGVSDLQLWQYQAAIGRWTNATVSFGGGGTVSNVTDTVDIDLTLAAGSVSGVLTSTAITPGTYSNLLTATFDAKGRATSAAGSLNAASLTNLNATEIRSGTVADARLSSVLQRLSAIGAGVSGDIIYRDATGWTNLAKGADGTVLKLASGLPSWGVDNTNGTGGSGTTYAFTNGVTAVGTNVTANLLGAGGVTLSTNGSGVITITGSTITNSPVSGLWQTLGSVDFILVQYGTTNAAFTYTNYTGIITNISNIGDTGTDSRLQIRLDFNQNIGTNYFVAADFDGVDDLVSGQGTLFYSQETGRTNTFCELSIVDNGGYQYADYGHKVRLRVIKTDAVAGGGDWPTNVTTLNVDTLVLNSPIPAQYITNATPNTYAGFDASGILTNFPTPGGGSGSLLVNGGAGGTNIADSSDFRWTASGGTISGLLSNTLVTAGSYVGLLSLTVDAKGRATSLVASNNASALTNLNGTEIRSGTVSASVIDSAIARLAGPAFTGNPTINSTNVMAAVDSKAPLASPALTGNPTVNGTNLMASIDGKQPLDADLTALAGGTAMATLITNAVSVGAPTIYAGTTNVASDLANKQPLDSDLTTLATLNASALTNLNATELRSGTVPTNRLDANTVQLAVAGSTGTGTFMRTRTGVARTLILPAGAFMAENTAGDVLPATPFTNTWGTTTDASRMLGWRFSATSTNGINANFIWPSTWGAGTCNVRLFWKQLVAENGTGIAWITSLGSAADGDTMGNTLGSNVSIVDSVLNDTNKIAVTAWSSAITVGNTPAAGDYGHISIRRHPSHASDTASVEGVILGAILEFTESTTEPTDN